MPKPHDQSCSKNYPGGTCDCGAEDDMTRIQMLEKALAKEQEKVRELREAVHRFSLEKSLICYDSESYEKRWDELKALAKTAPQGDG